MGRILFFIREALRALRRSAAPSIAAIVTVVTTTLLLGVLVPVLKASAAKNADVRSEVELQVFLDRSTTKNQLAEVQHQLREIPHVTGTEYISPQEGLAILRGEVSGDALEGSLKELPKTKNPLLPPSFNVKLDDASNLKSVYAAILPPGPNGKPKPINGAINQVTGNDKLANKITQVTSALKIVLIVITALLLIASLMLVGNTIRLSIYARRREVEVMRLVGATNWFIRWPFVFEGLLVGVLGAGIAVGILWLGKVTVVDPLSTNFGLVNNLQTTSFGPLVAILVAAAMAVSALGSGITLRRFLRI
jgi:cell division transport system permease protein